MISAVAVFIAFPTSIKGKKKIMKCKSYPCKQDSESSYKVTILLSETFYKHHWSTACYIETLHLHTTLYLTKTQHYPTLSNIFVRITYRRVSLQNKENMIEPYESIVNGSIDLDAKKYSRHFIRQLVCETPGDSPSLGKTWNFVRMWHRLRNQVHVSKVLLKSIYRL